MNTKHQKSKTEQYSLSRLIVMHYLSAEKGQHSYTVLYRNDNGTKQVIGRIYREYDPIAKKITYHAKDWQGNEIFTPTQNLYEVKKQFKENAQQLVPSVPTLEKRGFARVFSQLEQHIKEKEEKKSIGKTIKDKAQELTHSLVTPCMTSEDPVKDSAIEQLQREEEVKKLREKNNGKEKGLTR